ncbi:MAG: AAA family ATPase [Clostridia bacterium]|jgi:hypothetical protein|nr:AAA family ATPase [Clostridia bacterium]
MKIFDLLQQQFSIVDMQSGEKKYKNEPISYLDLGLYQDGGIKKINTRFYTFGAIIVDRTSVSVDYDNTRCYVRFYDIPKIAQKYTIDDNLQEFRCVISDNVEYCSIDKSGKVCESNDSLIFVYIALCFSAVIKDDDLRLAFLNAEKNKSALKKFVVATANYLNKDYDIKSADLSAFDVAEMHSMEELFCNKSHNCAVETFAVGTFCDEYLDLIPRLNEKYSMLDDYEYIAKAISNSDVTSVLMYGESGTGKSMACKLICEAIGMPVMSTINCTDNLDEFVLGKFIPSENGFVFAESMFTKAIRDGGAVIVEEINFARPEMLSFLNSLLDFNGFVTLDDGRTVKRNPNFRFFATMNLNYYGTRDLNLALQNRFSIIKKFKPITDEIIKNNLLRIDESFTPFVSQTLKIYHSVRKYIETNGADAVITPRTLESFVRLGKIMPYQQAAKLTLYQIKPGDDAMERAISELFGQYVWEKQL